MIFCVFNFQPVQRTSTSLVVTQPLPVWHVQTTPIHHQQLILTSTNVSVTVATGDQMGVHVLVCLM